MFKLQYVTDFLDTYSAPKEKEKHMKYNPTGQTRWPC